MYYDQVNDIYLVSKMGQIIKVQRPVCDIRGRIYNSVAGGIIVQLILEAAFTIAWLWVLLHK